MNDADSLALTDLYQLTMLQGYLDHGMEGTAVFEFFVRKLPRRRGFLMAAGLERLLEFLTRARFDESALAYLEGSGLFRANLLDYLRAFRFTGRVDAMAEGTLFFADEPIIRVTAPLPAAQLIETRLINLLQLPCLVATKAARCRLAAPDKRLVDFGLRRAHGAESGMAAARAAYLAGFDGTSNVLAGQAYGIPIFGTMAHAFIQAHDSETLAFEHFAQSQPGNLVLLVDTYDSGRGAQRVAALADRLPAGAPGVKAVRIDSGDLGEEAVRVRALLDRGGHPEIGIFASSGVDEYLLARLRRQGAPIDGYGIGTSLTTSADAPFLNCAYKLQEYDGIARRKRSRGKLNWPGRKQVFRYMDGDGRLEHDRLGLEGEAPAGGTPLLRPVMRDGQRLEPAEPLAALRERARAQLATLPPAFCDPGASPRLPLEVSPALAALARETDARFSR